MKERFIIQGTIADKITYYHLLIFAVALPYDRLYSELALMSLCIHTIIHLRKENIRRFTLKGLWIPAVIYLLTVIGTTYTHFLDEAFYEWERQLALLLFPLVFLVNSFDFYRYRVNILLGLAFSCFLALLYLYYNAFAVISYNHLKWSAIAGNAFINHNFSAPIDMHATYFSMYIALAATGLICTFLATDKRIWKWIYACMFIVLVAGLIQLSSRAVLIAFAVIINTVIPFLFLRKRQRLVFIGFSLLVSISIFFTVTRMDDLKTRFIVDLKEDLTQASDKNNLLEPRMVRWKTSLELIKTSPVYGNGSGSEVALLKELYYRDKLYNSYLNDLNVHNQYLSMFIKTGIIGFAVLAFIFAAGFRKAIRLRDAPFCAFLVITAVVGFSENILDANKGIFFFAFFFSLFYRAKDKTNEVPFIQK
jgi:O-antigen ligase